MLLTHPDAYYDTSGLKNHLFAIETSIGDFGCDRMVYGSQYPLFCMKSTIFLIKDAELNQTVKERIFYKNAETLFKNI